MELLRQAAGIDVVVVDHDTIVRRAVVAELSASGFVVAAHTPFGREGIRLAIELGPAVVIVDLELPDIDGLEFVRTVHRASPNIAILVLATVADDELALRALRMGAGGFLAKHFPLDALPRIVHALASGEAVVTRALTMRIVERLRRTPECGAGLRPVRSPLSSREWQVLDLICAGAGTREIADDLELSVETVRSHVKRILRKLDAHSRQEAAQIAARMLADRTLSERAGASAHPGRSAARLERR